MQERRKDRRLFHVLLTDALRIFGMVDDHEVINLHLVEPRVDQGQADISSALKRLKEPLNKDMAGAKHTALEVSLAQESFFTNAQIGDILCFIVLRAYILLDLSVIVALDLSDRRKIRGYRGSLADRALEITG